MPVLVDPSGLRLVGRGDGGDDGDHGDDGGELLPLLAGSMHYFQHPRAAWGRCLDALAELGIGVVDTYVPWAIHEVAPGRFDFEGGSSASGASSSDRYNRALLPFLEACAGRGLKVLLRPGPHINAELTLFGFPERILADGRCLARGAAGNPVIVPAPPRFFPAPSYASERFLDEAEAWLRAVAAAVAPQRHDAGGPVVAAQVDNELALFFRTAAYDQDYHGDAIDKYRRWLVERHGEALPAGYAGVPAAEVEPPRRLTATNAESLVPHIEWVAFKEALVAGALARLGAALREGGLDGVALTHNFPAGAHGESVSLAHAERSVDVASLDLYLIGRDYPATRRAARTVAGSSRLPMLGELGWGGFLWWPPQALEDQLSTALAALMHGVRAVNFYMVVERDRWHGAPVGPRGERRHAAYEATQQLVAAVREAELWSMQRHVDVALLRVREQRWLQRVTSLLDPLPPLLLGLLGAGPHELCSDETFGFASAVQREAARVERMLEEALEELGMTYDIVDSDCDLAALTHYRVVIAPSFEFIDVALLDRLSRYVAEGGTLVWSPRVPEVDARMRPLERSLPSHRLISGEEPSEGLENIARELGILPPLPPDEGIEIAHFKRGVEQVIFVANAHDSSRTVSLEQLDLGGARWVWDALTGVVVNPRAMHVEARQVRMLRSRPSSTGPVPRQPRPDRQARDASDSKER